MRNIVNTFFIDNKIIYNLVSMYFYPKLNHFGNKLEIP